MLVGSSYMIPIVYRSADQRKDVNFASSSPLRRVFFAEGTTGPQVSQQPTESHITRVCMEIYITIDEMVKMYKNSY